MLLEVAGLTKTFGGLTAVKNVSFYIKEGEIVGLIGPNGAGKTTIFNLLNGVYKPTAGNIMFNGENITNISLPSKVCHKGIGRTFQIVRPFGDMTVLENVMVGAFIKTHHVNQARKFASEILDFVNLGHRKDTQAKSLTTADRKRLEVARALATKPKLLLLDEVMAGLNPAEVMEVVKIIGQIRAQGVTIFLIEHIMAAIMSLSERILVLHHGEKIAEGPPKVVSHDPKVIEAYLGEEMYLA